jgi:hypothetical protein
MCIHRFVGGLPLLAIVSALVLALPNSTLARQWTDKSGNFHLEAELVFVEEGVVVLDAGQKGLVAVRLEQLSDEDVAFVKSEGAREAIRTRSGTDADPEWELVDGTVIKGSLTEVTVQRLVIARKLSKIYVNAQPLEDARPIYHKLIPLIVNHFEGTHLQSLKEVEDFLTKRSPPAVEYVVESVVLSTESAGAIHIPNFLFKERFQTMFAPALARARALQEAELSEEEIAAIRQEERALLYPYRSNAIHTGADPRAVRMLRFGSAPVAIAPLEAWEVNMVSNVPYRAPFTALIFADDSASAGAIAAERFPGYVVGGVSRAN